MVRVDTFFIFYVVDVRQACTSLVGFSIGDFLAQKGTSKERFSYQRLARMAAFGFLFHGTISHFFYNALDGALPGTAAVTVIQKVTPAFFS